MLVSDLLAYDLVPSEAAAIRAVIPERLFPLQELAVRRGLIGGTTDLLIAGPPGSGKSALVELLALHAAHSGQKAIVVRADSARELLLQLVVDRKRLAGLLAEAELVIIDELESLRDPICGPLLEGLLQELRRRKQRSPGDGPGPRLVGFTLLLDGVAALAAQLGAELVTQAQSLPVRGVSIGVLGGGRLIYRPMDGASLPAQPSFIEEDLLLKPERCERGGGLIPMLDALSRRWGPTLVLWPDEASCVRMAGCLAASLGQGGEPARQALTALESTVPGRARSLLSKTLRCGVAVLTPSLTPQQRALVEKAVAGGEVRLVCASEPPPTGTARPLYRSVVVCSPWRWQRDRENRHWQRVDLDSVDCARLAGLCTDGPVLLYAHSQREARELWPQHINAPPRPLPPRRLEPPAGPVELYAWAELGLPAMAIWRRWADANRGTAAGTTPKPVELLYIAALGPAALPLPLLLSEQPGADYRARLLKRLTRQKLGARPLFQSLYRSADELSHETLRAVKRTLLLLDWVEGVGSTEIENTYHLWIGAVGRLAADCAARLEALQALCAATGWSERHIDPLRELATNLRGRPVDAVAEHRPVGLGGDAAFFPGPPSVSRSLKVLVGALHAQKAARPPALQKSARLRRM